MGKSFWILHGVMIMVMVMWCLKEHELSFRKTQLYDLVHYLPVLVLSSLTHVLFISSFELAQQNYFSNYLLLYLHYNQLNVNILFTIYTRIHFPLIFIFVIVQESLRQHHE